MCIDSVVLLRIANGQLYTPPHDVGGYYGIMLVVPVFIRLSVHLSVMRLSDISSIL